MNFKTLKGVRQEMYLTSDISIAAYLLTKGHTIIEVKKDQRGQYFFQFTESEQIKKDALLFLNSDCAKYDSNMRLLRSLLKNS